MSRQSASRATHFVHLLSVGALLTLRPALFAGLALACLLRVWPVPNPLSAARRLNAPPPPVRIALLADPHCTRSTRGDHAHYRERFERVIGEVNAARVDLVLMAGDETNGFITENVREFQDLSRNLRAPLFFVPGNRDVGNRVGLGRRGQVSEEGVARYEKLLGRSFFVVEKKGVRVIGVNASLFGSGLSREQEQWRFLETQLGEPFPAPTLILSHYPPFLRKQGEPDRPRDNIDPASRARLIALAKQGAVRAVLSGHMHRTIRHTVDGILYLTGPAIAYAHHGKPRGWALLSVWPDGRLTVEFKYARDSKPPDRIKTDPHEDY